MLFPFVFCDITVHFILENILWTSNLASQGNL